MSGPWEDYTPSNESTPWEDFKDKAAPVTYEKPGLAKRLYEQNVVIPVRAARHLAPYPETIQEQVIDPAIGYFTGESPEQRKANREAYDRYLEEQYPRAREFYESRGAAAGGLLKGALAAVNPLMAAQQATEGLVEQGVTRPESLGFNPETTLNTANLLAHTALNAPKNVAGGLSYIKSRGPERPSLEAYRANPERFDIAEQRAGGQPIKSLEEEMQAALQAKEASKAERMAQLSGETAALKAEDARQVARAIEDVRTKTELGTYEGDAMKSAVKKLQDNYKATAETRNKILDETQGEMDISPLLKLVDQAESRVILPEHKAAVKAVKDDILAMAKPKVGSRIVEPTSSPDTNLPASNAPAATENYHYSVISPRELNVLREKLQQNVSWGGHSQPWEVQYKGLARDFNDILDMSIPGNNPLRNQIREETIRYNMADDLFGGDFPLKKFEAATKDPMKRRELENLNIPEIDDILKTIDYRTNFNKNLKLGERPKSDVIEEYLAKKKELEGVRAETLPMSSRQVPSQLESAMMSTYRNPRINQSQAVKGYAEQVHPQGPEDFYNKFEESKVLRDVAGMDAANGSRLAQMGRGAGAMVGGMVGMATDNPALWVPTLAGGGAMAGGALDFRASNLFRSAARGAKAMEPVSQAYYPYAGMSRQQTIEHYLRSQRDHEYAQSIEDEKKMREGRQ